MQTKRKRQTISVAIRPCYTVKLVRANLPAMAAGKLFRR